MKSKVIYAIDDEPDILEALSIILKEEGYTVLTDTQFNSVSHILSKRPNLILLDLLLIGANGKDICTQIRHDWRGRSIPIVFVSAHPENKLHQYTNQCQANGYLQKPFDIDMLLKTVKQYLGN